MNLSRSHAEAPQPSFDRIARLYRWLEYCTFGRLLERCRFAQLGRLGGAKFALILGDGDGRFLAELVRINPRLQADVVDVSEAMLTLARARVSHAAGLNFQRVDIRSFQPPPAGTTTWSLRIFFSTV